MVALYLFVHCTSFVLKLYVSLSHDSRLMEQLMNEVMLQWIVCVFCIKMIAVLRHPKLQYPHTHTHQQNRPLCYHNTVLLSSLFYSAVFFFIIICLVCMIYLFNCLSPTFSSRVAATAGVGTGASGMFFTSVTVADRA